MTFALTIIALFAMVALGVPIAFAIGIAAWGYMMAAGVPAVVFAQQVASGPDSWILLAMPLFILSGLLMNATELAHRIIIFADALVGHLRGGLAMVNVVASMLFGGISGSAVADSAAMGTVLIPGMKKKGYSTEVSAAITSSSSSIGIIIPPSISMILFGAITGASAGTLFIAGIVPGIMIGLTMMAVIFVLARRHHWGGDADFSMPRLARTAVQASWALFMPVVIIGGIVSGIFTPTEAGGVAVAYGIVVAVVIYRTLTLRKLYDCLVQAAVLTGVVMAVVAMSYTLGWVMTHELIPQAVASWISEQDMGRLAFLLVISVVLIALGAILHGDPLLLITVPIFMPAVAGLGIDPIHFGIVAVICVAIGQQTPPVGSVLFVVSAISRRDIFAVSRANVPFVMAMVFVLAVVIVFPDVVLWLPELSGMR